MKADLHVHTRESGSAPQHWLGEALGVRECYTQGEEAVAAALRHGMDLVAITNHNLVEDALRLAELRPDRVIPGCEYTVYAGLGRYVHVVALGVDRRSHDALSRERRRGLERFTGRAKEEGVVCFLAHPGWEVNRRKTGIEPEALIDWIGNFDIVETMNGNCPAENSIARGLARYFGKSCVGGSDSHGVASIGGCWTEAEAGSVEGFLDRLRSGETRACGQPQDHHGFAHMVREVLGAFYRRELFKASTSGSLEGFLEQADAGQIVRAAVQVALLPGLAWVPSVSSRSHMEDLTLRASSLGAGLVGYLTYALAQSVASGDRDEDERVRRWTDGLERIADAFGLAEAAQ